MSPSFPILSHPTPIPILPRCMFPTYWWKGNVPIRTVFFPLQLYSQPTILVEEECPHSIHVLYFLAMLPTYWCKKNVRIRTVFFPFQLYSQPTGGRGMSPFELNSFLSSYVSNPRTVKPETCQILSGDCTPHFLPPRIGEGVFLYLLLSRIRTEIRLLLVFQSMDSASICYRLSR